MGPLYHPITKRQLDALGSATTSYIFVGRPGTGRRLAATALTSRLNCLAGGSDGCAVCQNVASGTFADLKIIDTGQTIGIEQVQELQQVLDLRPFAAETTRIVIIEADNGITKEAQNRLLKTLEEPPRQTIIIIITRDVSSLLETVQSRCQVVRFLQPGPEQIEHYLRSQLDQPTWTIVEQLKPASVGQALSFAHDPEVRQTREEELGFAREFLSGSTFNRLVMSGQARSKPRALALVDSMSRLVKRSSGTIGQFNALERAQTQLLANVGPRVALEALALAL